MARGWESKSVEEQQSEFKRASEDERRQARERGEKQKERRALELKRARVLEQLGRSPNPRYTEMLRKELRQLEAELAQL